MEKGVDIEGYRPILLKEACTPGISPSPIKQDYINEGKGRVMSYKYMRIQGRELSYVTQYPKGIFSMCWRMVFDGKMSKEDEECFKGIDDWFKENLPEPEPCQKGEKVITFFKVENTEEMQEKIKPAMELLDKYEHPYDVVYTNHVGEIVYEDEWQVAVKVENGQMV